MRTALWANDARRRVRAHLLLGPSSPRIALPAITIPCGRGGRGVLPDEPAAEVQLRRHVRIQALVVLVVLIAGTT